MSESSHRTTIMAAVIGVIGSIVVALISNWDKFSDSPNRIDLPTIQPSTPTQTIQTITKPENDIAPIINIAGSWYDPNNPSDGYRITQEKNLFQFNGWGILPQGIRFESLGSGTVTGQNIKSTYITNFQNGWVARGSCSGTASSDGSRMTSTCSDNIFGTYPISVVRQ